MPGNYGNVNGYMWVPIVGPLVGGVIGAAIYDFFIRTQLVATGAEPDPEVAEGGRTAADRSTAES